MFATTPVSPTINTVYTAMGTDVHNCVLSNIVSVTVSDPPTVVASANKTTACKGDFVTLSAGGADTYTWNTGFVGAVVTYTLPIDIIYYYSVTGADVAGCKKTVNISVNVLKCLGVNEIGNSGVAVGVMPNPGTGLYNIVAENVTDRLDVQVYNGLGMLVKTMSITEGNNQLDLQNVEAGIYFMHVTVKDVIKTIKLIKE